MGVKSPRTVKVAAVKLDRRWGFATGVAVLAVVAFALSQFGVFGPSADDCRPVKELLEFNRSQGEQIAAKTGDSEGIPNVAEEGACTIPTSPQMPRIWPACPASSSASSLSCAHSRSRVHQARPHLPRHTKWRP